MSEPITFTVTNTCICYYCPDCDMATQSFDGDCPECGGDLEYMNDCIDCGDDMQESVRYAMGQWFENNPSEVGLWIIKGAGMGWRHLSGWKGITKDTDLTEAISVNSEWTQEWSVDPKPGGRVHIVQSHHDSLGEGYDIEPVSMETIMQINERGILADLHKYANVKPDDDLRALEVVREYMAEHWTEKDYDTDTLSFYIDEEFDAYVRDRVVNEKIECACHICDTLNTLEGRG